MKYGAGGKYTRIHLRRWSAGSARCAVVRRRRMACGAFASHLCLSLFAEHVFKAHVKPGDRRRVRGACRQAYSSCIAFTSLPSITLHDVSSHRTVVSSQNSAETQMLNLSCHSGKRGGQTQAPAQLPSEASWLLLPAGHCRSLNWRAAQDGRHLSMTAHFVQMRPPKHWRRLPATALLLPSCAEISPSSRPARRTRIIQGQTARHKSSVVILEREEARTARPQTQKHERLFGSFFVPCYP